MHDPVDIAHFGGVLRWDELSPTKQILTREKSTWYIVFNTKPDPYERQVALGKFKEYGYFIQGLMKFRNAHMCIKEGNNWQTTL